MNQSGVTLEDQIVKAMAMYVALYQRVFIHDNVWRMLKECSKWRQNPAPRSTPTKRARPETSADSIDSDDEVCWNHKLINQSGLFKTGT